MSPSGLRVVGPPPSPLRPVALPRQSVSPPDATALFHPETLTAPGGKGWRSFARQHPLPVALARPMPCVLAALNAVGALSLCYLRRLGISEMVHYFIA